MKGQDALFSSRTDEWATPLDLFDWLDAEFDFILDVCATANNAKCPQFYDRDTNALTQDWRGVCWMNPPYGLTIGWWVEKAWESAQAGATVVCLLPARTDTIWWHQYCMTGEIRFIKGRLTFGSAANPATFPSVVIIFRPDQQPTLGQPIESSPFAFTCEVNA